MATREELEALKRSELNDVAVAQGVVDPESYPDKSAVVDAIIEARQDDDSTDDDMDDDDVEAEAPPAPTGDVDVATLSDEEYDGETPAPVQPDSGVILGEDGGNVPDEYVGHPALVIGVKNPEPWEEDVEPVFTVRTRDEHNAILELERDDFAEVLPGGVGNRAFGP
jgi:hypothetical protein